MSNYFVSGKDSLECQITYFFWSFEVISSCLFPRSLRRFSRIVIPEPIAINTTQNLLLTQMVVPSSPLRIKSGPLPVYFLSSILHIIQKRFKTSIYIDHMFYIQNPLSLHRWPTFGITLCQLSSRLLKSRPITITSLETKYFNTLSN